MQHRAQHSVWQPSRSVCCYPDILRSVLRPSSGMSTQKPNEGRYNNSIGYSSIHATFFDLDSGHPQACQHKIQMKEDTIIQLVTLPFMLHFSTCTQAILRHVNTKAIQTKIKSIYRCCVRLNDCGLFASPAFCNNSTAHGSDAISYFVLHSNRNQVRSVYETSTYCGVLECVELFLHFLTCLIKHSDSFNLKHLYI